MGLDATDTVVLEWLEQVVIIERSNPSPDKFLKKFPGKFKTEASVTEWMQSESVAEVLDGLGIRKPENDPVAAEYGITSLQFAVIRALFDVNDTRSDKKKLNDYGVSTLQFASWKKDPAFQRILKRFAEGHFEDHIDDVTRSIVDQARGGDLGAGRLILEMTGRYSKVGDVDVNRLITVFIESVAKHVPDPLVLDSIAKDLASAVGGPAALLSLPNAPKSANSVVVKGEITSG